MQCNYFSVHGNSHCGLSLFSERVHDSCSIYHRACDGQLLYKPILNIREYLLLTSSCEYYVFYVDHVRISCSAAKDCVVNNLDTWIIMLSLRPHMHMIHDVICIARAVVMGSHYTTHNTSNPIKLFRTARYASSHRLHHLPVHMLAIWSIVELSISHDELILLGLLPNNMTYLTLEKRKKAQGTDSY